MTSEESETPGLARNRSVNVCAMHSTVQQNQACTVTQCKRGQPTEWWQVKSHLSSFTLNPLVPHSLLLPPLYNRALVKLDNKEGCDRNLPKTLTDCQKEELTTVLTRIPATPRGWFEWLSISQTVPQPIGSIFFFFLHSCNKWSVWVL